MSFEMLRKKERASGVRDASRGREGAREGESGESAGKQASRQAGNRQAGKGRKGQLEARRPLLAARRQHRIQKAQTDRHTTQGGEDAERESRVTDERTKDNFFALSDAMSHERCRQGDGADASGHQREPTPGQAIKPSQDKRPDRHE